MKLAVLSRGLVQGAYQRLDIGFEPGDLLGVSGPQFLESSDLPAQPAFAVRSRIGITQARTALRERRARHR